jgi:phage FluMu protein Com
MGELYFQCPACGTVEHVNNIGKMLLAAEPSAFTSIECLKCQHRYNARARLRNGCAPGGGGDSV